MGSLLPLLLLILLAAANADNIWYNDCPTNMNYSSGGAFQANLADLLSSLPAAAAAAKAEFAERTSGEVPDEAYGLAQCRPDANASVCRACLEASVSDMAIKCPGQKTSMLLYDNCLLRYANRSFFGVADTNVVNYWPSPWNAKQPEQFNSLLDGLMENLTRRAVSSSPWMFAVGDSAGAAPFEKIYGMTQCTHDISADDCGRCLGTAVGNIQNYVDGKNGGQIIARSCYIRFEVFPFYNAHAVDAVMSPLPPPPPPPGDRANGTEHFVSGSPGRNGTGKIAVVVSIPIAAVMLLLLIMVFYLNKRNSKHNKHRKIVGADTGDEEGMLSSEFFMYDLITLRAATNNFSVENKLGQGAFGPVYKGTLQDGQEIAVKRLSQSSLQGHVEMKNEVVLLAKLQHKNLVRLLGCCIEEEEKLLVYEFLRNTSLDKILFDPARQQELSWGQRYKIMEGIGRGLIYLHQDSRLTIIHRDLKAGNVLLDPDMNPKISDFGLAKLLSVDASGGNTSHVAGTSGYMAPEYRQYGIFSAKSDVFSYGVLVLEIVMGRRRHPYGLDEEDLIASVWRHWSSGSVSGLLDCCLAEGRRPEEVLRCIHIGLLCVQEDANLRPGIAAVVVMLNSRAITLPSPTTPPFIDLNRVDADNLVRRNARQVPPTGATRTQNVSINDATISILEPR